MPQIYYASGTSNSATGMRGSLESGAVTTNKRPTKKSQMTFQTPQRNIIGSQMHINRLKKYYCEKLDQQNNNLAKNITKKSLHNNMMIGVGETHTKH